MSDSTDLPNDPVFRFMVINEMAQIASNMGFYMKHNDLEDLADKAMQMSLSKVVFDHRIEALRKLVSDYRSSQGVRE